MRARLKSHKGIVAIAVVVFVVVIGVVFRRGLVVVQQAEKDRSRSGLVAVPHTIAPWAILEVAG